MTTLIRLRGSNRGRDQEPDPRLVHRGEGKPVPVPRMRRHRIDVQTVGPAIPLREVERAPGKDLGRAEIRPGLRGPGALESPRQGDERPPVSRRDRPVAHPPRWPRLHRQRATRSSSVPSCRNCPEIATTDPAGTVQDLRAITAETENDAAPDAHIRRFTQGAVGGLGRSGGRWRRAGEVQRRRAPGQEDMRWPLPPPLPRLLRMRVRAPSCGSGTGTRRAPGKGKG